MLRYFTSFQIFVAAALGLVVFIGVLWVEQTEFRHYALLQDPFVVQQNIDERIVASASEQKSWLHQTGEWFLLSPGSKFNLINQARELEEGTLFIDTRWQLPKAVEAAYSGLTAPFETKTFKPNSGQIKAGPVLISVPQGVAVIKRDVVRQETEVYAHDHPAYLYLPGGENSFLLPAGYVVLIKEERAARLAALYYTKLKKELNLQVFEAQQAQFKTLNQALLAGLQLMETWEVQVTDYAQRLPTSLDRFAPSSVMGRLLASLGYIQRYYALGVDKSYKTHYQYQQLKAPLKDAYFLINEQKVDGALEASQKFKTTLGDSQWARFFVEHESYNQRWQNFVRLQRGWFYTAFPAKAEVAVLRALWGPQAVLRHFLDFKEHYYLFENYYVKSFKSQAQEQLDLLQMELGEVLEKPTEEAKNFFESVDASAVSAARRQLSFALQADENLRNQANFTLYTQLVELEKQALGLGGELAQEIRLEVAQELLFFLKDLLDSSTRKDITVTLLRSYRNLEVSELAESLGRSVFSAQERDTLGRIQSLGALSDDKLKAVQDSNRAAADALALFETLKDEVIQEEQLTALGVQTAEVLVERLVAARVLTQGMKTDLQMSKEESVITFSQASFEGYPLSGTFKTGSQSFSVLQLGEVQEFRATIGNFAGFLNQMLVSNKKLSQTEIKPKEDGVNNLTPTAVLQRRNILKLLDQQGVQVSLDNVQLTSLQPLQASVTQSSFAKQYLLDFEFDQGPPIRIRNVTANYGRSTLLLSGEVFEIDNLSTTLENSIEAKLAASFRAED